VRNQVSKLIDLGYGNHKLATPTPSSAPHTDPALLTIAQAALRLGVGEGTVRDWIRDQTLFSVGLGVTGRVRMIPAGQIERMRNLGNGTAGQVQG
jgi:excisionase family DNA binding protein